MINYQFHVRTFLSNDRLVLSRKSQVFQVFQSKEWSFVIVKCVVIREQAILNYLCFRILIVLQLWTFFCRT